MIDKSQKYGLKGQYISALGNALGNEKKVKTVRVEKTKNTKNFFRTEIFPAFFKKRDFSNFVRNYINSLNCFVARTISTVCSYPRAMPGVIIVFPLQGNSFT
jgi:hypothetical protein